MPSNGNNHTTALPGEHLLQLESIGHTYSTAAGLRPTLHNVSLSIMRGQSCAIVGASGSGKSTLLNIIGLLDQPTSGRLLLDGHDMTRAKAHIRAQTRNQRIGFVFQSFNLLPRLSALENVALPLRYRGYGHAEAQRLALQEVTRVGLANRAHHRPAELSGGQRQRIAIARALVGRPDLILADEPTGNLDSATAGEVLALLQALNREQGVTLVIVTHDESLAQTLQRCLLVKDGHLLEQYPNPAHA
ncbi:ABC transporter ATP-binding protein [Pseudomonas sp. AL 58]|uniref:ABC transporter ATP-binding protein n=1 Tax=Pseudomonas sp. AL 58 TaxID=3104275 RepID=UPI002EBB611E|nr:ABC transporter ATP-binding protein [Pseudomonas sp. AL 58]